MGGSQARTAAGASTSRMGGLGRLAPSTMLLVRAGDTRWLARGDYRPCGGVQDRKRIDVTSGNGISSPWGPAVRLLGRLLPRSDTDERTPSRFARPHAMTCRPQPGRRWKRPVAD